MIDSFEQMYEYALAIGTNVSNIALPPPVVVVVVVFQPVVSQVAAEPSKVLKTMGHQPTNQPTTEISQTAAS